MARGGKRQGAGRKKGQVSQQTKRRVEIAEQALATGITPLDFMLAILRDENRDDRERFMAAKEAAPYLHPRLSAVEHSGNIARSAEELPDAELERIAASGRESAVGETARTNGSGGVH